jgi:hypothetical protein
VILALLPLLSLFFVLWELECLPAFPRSLAELPKPSGKVATHAEALDSAKEPIIPVGFKYPLRPMPFGGAMVRLPLLHGRIHFVSYSL